MPKSFKDYALFCIRTNNIEALLKGYLSLFKIQFMIYSRCVLRCHRCRKKTPSAAKMVQEDTLKDKRKKLRNQGNMSSVPPIWWQNSKVSYSYFASGSSSFLDFTTKDKKQPHQQSGISHKQSDEQPDCQHDVIVKVKPEDEHHSQHRERKNS